MKRLILLLIITSTLSGCDMTSIKTTKSTLLTIDSQKSTQNQDLSYLFTGQYDIVKLETSDNCIVAADSKMAFTDKHIIVSDKMTQKISVFDWNGKFIKNIGNVGNGPKEYIRLGEFTVSGEHIYVTDAQSDKMLIYPILDGEISELRTEPFIPCSGIIFKSENLYYYTNNLPSADKYFNIVRVNLKDNSRKMFIPFDDNIYKNHLSWGLNNPISTYGDTTLMIFARDNTIYGLVDDEIINLYTLDFPRNKMPDELLSKTGTEIMMASQSKGYNMGLNKIYNTQNYILGEVMEGAENQNFVYDKRNNQLIALSPMFSLNDLGGVPADRFEVTKDNKFIIPIDSHRAKEYWNYILKESAFKSSVDKDKLRTTIESLSDTDNPILIVARFK